MMEFQARYAFDMDGGANTVPENVTAAQHALDLQGYRQVGDGVDLALAAVFNNSDTPGEAVDHLEYIIRQLQIARANLVVAREGI